MRKRYIQVEDELLKEFASDLSVDLGCNKLEAIGHSNLLFSWAINRCPKDRPPSASALHTGPLIEKQIARACEYHGEPTTFIDAYVRARPQVLERVDGGVRFKGLARYDGLWAKNYPAAAKAWRAAHPDWRPQRAKDDDEDEPGEDRAETGRSPNGNREESPPLDQHQDRDVETDEKKDAFGEEEHQQPNGHDEPLRDDDDEYLWRSVLFRRKERGLPRELTPPRGWKAFVVAAVAEGFTLRQLELAHVAFVLDRDFERAGWPTAVFITSNVWRCRAKDPPRERDALSGVTRASR